MAYKRTKDLLDRARLFHERLGELYKRLETVSKKEQVKMLLDYMSRHEKHLTESLSKYEEEASRRVMDYWYKYTPNNKSCEHLENIELRPDMTIDDVISLAMRMDECLVELYRSVAENAESEEVKEIFNSLLEMEKQEEVELLRNALDLK